MRETETGIEYANPLFPAAGERPPVGDVGERTAVDALGAAEARGRAGDTDIQHGVASLIDVDPDVDATEITVEVNQGHVRLSGTVYEGDHKILAEGLAEAVPGVRTVRNDLVVPAPDLWNERT